MNQQDRRRDPYPWTWEPAALLAGTVGLVLLAGLQAGRTIANGLATSVWRVAPPGTWLTSAGPLLLGHAGAGLHPAPATVAAAPVLRAVSVLAEAVLLLPTVVLLRTAARRWSPAQPRGYATPAQTERVLGLTRLRANAHLIRPDLPPSATRRLGAVRQRRDRRRLESRP